MKVKIDKKTRIIVGVIIFGILFASSFFLYREYRLPQYTDQEASLYTCNNKTAIDYRVFLRPNLLYRENSLGEGETYITEFVDYIQANFSYSFDADQESKITGSYEIIGEIEGYMGQDETYKTLWKKQNILLPKKELEGLGKSLSIEKTYSLNIHEFNEFARSVIEASKITSSIKLTVFINVDMEAATDQGLVADKISSTMVVPLNTSYFEIGGDLINEKVNGIHETLQIQVPMDKKKIILSGGIGILCLCGLLYLYFFTEGLGPRSPLERKLKRIFKNYGNRLVALNNGLVTYDNNCSEVKSIEDLVRISDEICKPIMYRYNDDFTRISKFYLVDGEKIFVFDINKIIENNQLKRKASSKP